MNRCRVHRHGCLGIISVLHEQGIGETLALVFGTEDPDHGVSNIWGVRRVQYISKPSLVHTNVGVLKRDLRVEAVLVIWCQHRVQCTIVIDRIGRRASWRGRRMRRGGHLSSVNKQLVSQEHGCASVPSLDRVTFSFNASSPRRKNPVYS